MEFKSKKDSPPKSHFTPGSKGSNRPKPYTSLSTGGYGRNNVRRSTFQFKGASSANTTPRRFQNNKFSSRADKIMENSILKTEKDPPTKLNTWLSKKEPAKRPLATNNTQSEQKKEQKKKEYDPYNVFSDASESEEDEIFLSHKKTAKSEDKQNKEGVRPSGLFVPSREAKTRLFADAESPKPNFYSNKESPKSNFYSNKENTNFGSPEQSKSQYSFNSYKGSARRKQYPFKNKFKSPVKVERLYGEQDFGGSLFGNADNTKENEKENIPVNSGTTISDSLESRVSQPHLLGFPNTGNTCYLNAVVQSLLALPSFTSDLQYSTSTLSPDRTSLFHSLGQLLHCRNKLQIGQVRAKLRLFKENLVGIDNSFSGFKMQDANEFLTRLMDTIKDEVERCHMTTPSPDHPSTSTERVDLTPEHPGALPTQCFEPSIENEFTNRVDDPFADDLFGPTTDIDKEENICKSDENKSSQRLMESNACESDIGKNERTSEGALENGGNASTLNKDSLTSPHKEEKFTIFSDNSLFPSSVSSPKTKVSDYSSEGTYITPKDKSVSGENFPRNPIKDNFEFHLMESYRCLSCCEVVSRNQEYFGLYVNLPETDRMDESFSEDVKLSGEGLTTVQDAIDSYLKTDERELNCEKCGHDKAEVVTAATSLPRILVVQLKRYEYKPEMFESIKVSSRVCINEWISLDKFVTDDVQPIKLCETDSSSAVPKAPKQATLTVRNLSSELNVLEKPESKENKVFSSPLKASFKSPVKPDVITVPSADQEDEELQEVMRRSMDDMGGPGTAQGPNQEEDEIQQAIRLSLQDVGMSFSVENQEDSRDGFDGNKNEEKNKTITDDRHTYRLMSIISHFGLTTKTGHYVSDVYNATEKSWFHYDDETVTPITESVVTAGGRQKNGYIFFYIHRDLYEKMEKSEDKGR